MRIRIKIIWSKFPVQLRPVASSCVPLPIAKTPPTPGADFPYAKHIPLLIRADVFASCPLRSGASNTRPSTSTGQGLPSGRGSHQDKAHLSGRFKASPLRPSSTLGVDVPAALNQAIGLCVCVCVLPADGIPHHVGVSGQDPGSGPGSARIRTRWRKRRRGRKRTRMAELCFDNIVP